MNTYRILIFGSAQEGKSSVIKSLIQGHVDNNNNFKLEDIEIGGNARGCSFETKEYKITRNGNNYIFVDTCGLNETEEGTVPNSKAIRNLLKLINDKEGFNLIIFSKKKKCNL